MEQELLKKLLNNKFFTDNKSKVLASYFDGELKTLFDVIVKAHEQYNADLSTEWVNQLILMYYPATSTAAKKVLANLLDDVRHTDEPPDAMARDILQKLFEQEKARQISQLAIQVLNGDKTIADLQTQAANLLEDVDVEVLEKYEEVGFDLDGLLTYTDKKNLYKFRHPGLSERIPGAGAGNFIIVFGRPESGKSALTIFEGAGYLKQGLRVGYFANEEPAKRIYLRLICSALNLSEEEVRVNVVKAKEDFAPLAKNLCMIDCVAMDINHVDTWARKNKPDVILLDQLDKFSIDGKFNRDDQRLGELYCYAREISKRHDCLVLGVCQASAEAEGVTNLDFSMMAGSKTSKAAEADIIIGIGKNKMGIEDDPYRQLCVSKNKINGWHGFVGAKLDAARVQYEA